MADGSGDEPGHRAGGRGGAGGGGAVSDEGRPASAPAAGEQWRQEQLRELQKRWRNRERPGELAPQQQQRSRELLRQLQEEQERRAAAERTASAASRVKDMHDEVAKHKVAAEKAEESERLMKQELLRARQGGELPAKATEAREAQMHAEQQQSTPKRNGEAAWMHGLEARAAMMLGGWMTSMPRNAGARAGDAHSGDRYRVCVAREGRPQVGLRALEIKSATMMQAQWRASLLARNSSTLSSRSKSTDHAATNGGWYARAGRARFAAARKNGTRAEGAGGLSSPRHVRRCRAGTAKSTLRLRYRLLSEPDEALGSQVSARKASV